MRFVHLTPQPMISRIRKNGIRLGGGRRGRGVYAVPLMLFGQVALTDDDRLIEANARSSTTLWKWLSMTRSRHRHLAAVVFQTSLHHWPAELYVEITSAMGIDWLVRMPAGHTVCSDEDLAHARGRIRAGHSVDLNLTAHSASDLGSILQALQSAGFQTCDRFNESLELVFPAPIDPSLIQWVTPLYRTNQQFKQHRDRPEDDV